jgi:hypothetical protein
MNSSFGPRSANPSGGPCDKRSRLRLDLWSPGLQAPEVAVSEVFQGTAFKDRCPRSSSLITS